VVQGQPPEWWNWVGGYLFDKAKGIGGVHARDLRALGQPMDATPYGPRTTSRSSRRAAAE
jgi:hypothetical protein